MILVDTHVVVWLALQPERISKKAGQPLRTPVAAGKALGSLI